MQKYFKKIFDCNYDNFQKKYLMVKTAQISKLPKYFNFSVKTKNDKNKYEFDGNLFVSIPSKGFTIHFRKILLILAKRGTQLLMLYIEYFMFLKEEFLEVLVCRLRKFIELIIIMKY